MPEAEIVFETADGTLIAVLADAVRSETHRLEATATEHAVERGAAITDHVRAARDVLSLEITITDSPIRQILVGDRGVAAFEATGDFRDVDLDLPARQAASRYARGGPPAEGLQTEERAAASARAQIWQPDADPVTRTIDSWSTLLAARDGAWLAQIVTELRTYESMVLVSAETTRTAVRWLEITLDFAEVQQVSTELVDVVEVARPRDRRTQDQGSQPTDQPDEALQSVLSSTLEGIGGLF